MDGMRKTAFWCAMVVAAAGLGCASSGPGAAPAAGVPAAPAPTTKAATEGPRKYSCKDGSGIVLERIVSASGTKRVRITFADGTTSLLAPIEDQGKTRYVDGIVTLGFEGEIATVTYASGNKPPLLDCRPR